MNDTEKNREQLLDEITLLRERLEALEKHQQDFDITQNSHCHQPFNDTTHAASWPPEFQMAFYKFSVEVAADEVFWMQRDSKILLVNDAATRRLGYSQNEMQQMYVWDWDPQFTPETWATFWQDIQEKKSMTFETTHRTKTGELFPVEISASIFDYCGHKYLFAFAKDITNRKILENRLRNKYAEFEAIFNSITDAIVFTDTQRRIIMINPAFTDILGYSQQDAVGKTTKFYYATPEEYTQQGIARYNRNSTIDSPLYEISYRRKDKTIFPSETLGVAVRDANQELIGFIAIIRDISARITAEKAIKENRAQLETALSSMTDGVFISNSAGELVEMNDAWAQFHRFKEKKDVLRHVDEYPSLFTAFLADGKPVPVETWATSRALRGETGTNAEYTMHRKDTDETWVGSYSFSPIRDDHGAIVGSVVVARDITELKQKEAAQRHLEERLNQAQKMEAIGTLAGGIAHDFNNILSAILGYTEISLVHTSPHTQLSTNLNQILTAANRAADLVKQILVFSRQSEVELTPLKIQPVIKEGLKMLRSSIPTTISILEDIDPQCGAVLADPTQVHQILINLCTNAYHAMEQFGGTLAVTLQPTFIDTGDHTPQTSLSPGEYVKLTVSDSGTGIGPDLLDRIFDPYFTTKETGKGTGMGLAIVHGIIKNYGGTITVESSPGHGTTFHVYFPSLKEDAVLEKTDASDIQGGKERILLVDDEQIIAEMSKTLLEQLGYHVTEQHTSIDALTTFQNTPYDFDLVITDQTMPCMTGAELAQKILKIRPEMPVILCTGYSNLIDKQSAKAIGIKGFTLKPLRKKSLAKLIRKVLDEM